MKEQGQTSVQNYQTQVARVNQNLSFLKEKHTFRNHLKAFVADAPLIDQVLSQEQDGTFKLTAP
jgi:hypothetical protein